MVAVGGGDAVGLATGAPQPTMNTIVNATFVVCRSSLQAFIFMLLWPLLGTATAVWLIGVRHHGLVHSMIQTDDALVFN
jgi:hypothetical protein